MHHAPYDLSSNFYREWTAHQNQITLYKTMYGTAVWYAKGPGRRTCALCDMELD